MFSGKCFLKRNKISFSGVEERCPSTECLRHADVSGTESKYLLLLINYDDN